MYNIPARIASEMCFAARARRVNRVLTGVYDERLRAVGISIGQLDMLVTLMMERQPIRPVDLGHVMQMERSTVTRNLTKLQAMGLVEIRATTGKRDRHVSVTRKGERVVARAEAAWGEAQDAAKAILGDDGQRALDVVTQRVAAA